MSKTEVQALMEHWRARDCGSVTRMLESIGLMKRPPERNAGEVLNEILAFGSKAVPDLVQGLRHDDIWVRSNAMFALGKLRDPTTIPAIIDAMENDNDDYWRIRDSVPYALSQIDRLPPEALDRLRKALRHKHPHVRRIAAQALACVQPVETATVLELVKAAQDPDKDVRLQVVVSLGTIGSGSPEACRTLRAAFQDNEPWIRLWSADGLLKIDTVNRTDTKRTVLPVLRELLHSQEGVSKGEICWALCRLGPEAAPAIPDIITCLNDRDEHVRSSACSTLESLGATARPALEQLRKLATQDPDRFVRDQAASAAERIGAD